MRAGAVVLSILILAGAAPIFGESLTLVNRTGADINMVQAAAFGAENWGDDLIPNDVIADGDSRTVDLIGGSTWSFRLTDENSVTYVIYDAEVPSSGKIVVGPEHQARLSRIAGSKRTVMFSNATDYLVIGIRISSVTRSSWGGDLLEGRSIRPGTSMEIPLETEAGDLNFDIQYTLVDGDRNVTYVKSDVILTDGASLIIRSP